MTRKKPEPQLVVNESHQIGRKDGGGVLNMQVWQDAQGQTTSYRFAYINGQLFRKDNGRVLGYDNAHGEHHRHYFGRYERVNFESAEATMQQFITEWQEIVNEHCR